MADTLTAPAPSGTPAAPVVPVPAAPVVATPPASQSIVDAGAAFKAATSWGDVGIAEMATTDGEDAPDAVVAPPAGETTAATDDAPEFVQNAQGQWHRPDGTFANAEEIAAIDAQLATDAAAPPAAAEPPKPEEVAANTVTLRRRDGTTRDVVVDDPELAEEIRANYNDGMRRKEYTERVTAVEAKLAHLNGVGARIEKNPEEFVFNSLNSEQQVRLATMLLAQRFDDLVPIIQAYDANPSERIKATAEAQVRMRTQEAEIRTFAEAQQAGLSVRVALDALIPENAPEVDVREFYTFAGVLLTNAIARNEVVTAETAPKLVAGLAARYGFNVAAGATTPAAPKPRITLASPNGAPAVAQPANDPAKALADVKAGQKRIKLQQRNRANAAAVPPAGAGAPPVRLPPVPAGASIEDASRALKKQRSWTT